MEEEKKKSIINALGINWSDLDSIVFGNNFILVVFKDGHKAKFKLEEGGEKI